MNLSDAIKSGRPFRRAGRVHRWACVEDDLILWEDGSPLALSQASWLSADDWEIQEPEVTITRTQFWEAASQAFGFTFSKNSPLSAVEYTGPAAPPIAQIGRLANELGLEGFGK